MLVQLRAAGLAVVPREATPSMKQVFIRLAFDKHDIDPMWARTYWQDMVAEGEVK